MKSINFYLFSTVLRTMQPSLDYKMCNKIASNGFSFILLSRLIFIHDLSMHTSHTHTHKHSLFLFLFLASSFGRHVFAPSRLIPLIVSTVLSMCVKTWCYYNMKHLLGNSVAPMFALFVFGIHR